MRCANFKLELQQTFTTRRRPICRGEVLPHQLNSTTQRNATDGHAPRLFYAGRQYRLQWCRL